MSTPDTEHWDAVSHAISSSYRVSAIQCLHDQPATPSYIAETDDLSVAHASRALQELRGEEMVELLVSEDRKKGRVYGLTEKGEAVAERLEQRGEI